MSISTGGEQRRPSVVAAGKKAPTSRKPSDSDEATQAGADDQAGTAKPAAKAAGESKAAKSGGTRPGGGKPGGRPAGKGAGKGPGGRARITPVKVSQGRNWGPIALFTAVGVLAAGIIGYGAYAVWSGARSWQDRAGDINGLVNFRETNPAVLTQNHKPGPLQYQVNPPVGGDHSPTWMRCLGDVYDAQIPSENAVHSMEHGAVWITYRPDLPREQVEALAGKVRGNDFMLMSPFPGLDRPISLQAWGFQLKVDNASDGRIDQFVSALRENASLEPGAPCSSGNYTTGTGTTPRDLSSQTDPNAGQPGAPPPGQPGAPPPGQPGG